MSENPPTTVRNVEILPEDVAAVTDTLRSLDLSGNGAAVRHYEDALASYFGSRHAVACSSGTAAIHLALLAITVQPGDEVMIPATTPAMTALAVVAVGARPVFVDTAATTSFAVDLADADQKLTDRTRAIISVPMWGYPADTNHLAQYCRDRQIRHLEDAAQAHGTVTPDGALVGSGAAITMFSTHTRKLLCTGEGGFCLTDDDDLASRVRQARNLGRPQHGRFGETFGLNYKLAAPAAALGRSQLSRLSNRLARRRAIWNNLADIFADHPALLPIPLPGKGQPNGYAYLVSADSATAGRFAACLESNGILPDTSIYEYAPTYRAGCFVDGQHPTCPNVESLCRSLVALPCHEALNSGHLRRISEAARAVSP